MQYLPNIQAVAQCATANSPNENHSHTHFSTYTQPNLGAAPSSESLKGWAIRVHPFAGYTLENSHHQYILGCFASTAAAAKFVAYLPAAEDCDFGSIRMGGVA